MAAGEGFGLLQGHVEMDEAYVGGHRPGKARAGALLARRSLLASRNAGGDIRAKSVL